MQVVLLYPPPWKIPAPGEKPDQSGEGPPKHWAPNDRFSGDEITLPYGLLSLAAQAKHAGHKVTLLNLYLFAWQDVVRLIQQTKAKIYGLSCFTSNRRGTLSLARLIRQLHPQSYIVLGGPHATALPKEIMEYCEAVDGIVTGEGEITFMTLLDHLNNGKPMKGIAGMAWRYGKNLKIEPPRQRINNLDNLIPPYDHCEGHIFISSRGCPGNCTFCGSPSIWGKKVRFHSAEYTLNVLEKMVKAHNKKYICIKDDTFTANRKRVLEICKGIEKRKLNFLWSCDTRVDTLNEEVLFAMRKAGCQFISLGVESGSPEILKSIQKQITPEKILHATEMAKKYGFTIRYYMMACNREETAETLQASIDLIIKAKPNQFLFCFLTLYPGTKEFEIAECKGYASKEMFFAKDLLYFSYFPKNGYDDQMTKVIDWINSHTGIREFWDYSASDRKQILKHFLDLPAAYMDLGKAYYQEGNLAEAEICFLKAIKMGFPLPELGYNYIACLLVERGKFQDAIKILNQAKNFCNHLVIEDNLKSLHDWLYSNGSQNSNKPELRAYHEFETHHSGKQPVMPAPITLHDASTSKIVRLVPQQ